MLNTIYEDEYKREHLQNTVDNLNLLYVAFTRAKSRLFIYGTAQKVKSEKKGGKGVSLSMGLHKKRNPRRKVEKITRMRMPSLPHAAF